MLRGSTYIQKVRLAKPVRASRKGSMHAESSTLAELWEPFVVMVRITGEVTVLVNGSERVQIKATVRGTLVEAEFIAPQALTLRQCALVINEKRTVPMRFVDSGSGVVLLRRRLDSNVMETEC